MEKELNVLGKTTLANTAAGNLTATKITSPTYQFQNNVGLRSSTTYVNVSTLGDVLGNYEGYDVAGRYTLMSSDKNSFISSNFVKEVHKLGGDVSKFVSTNTIKILDNKNT